MDKFRLCKRFLYNIQTIEKVILSFSEDFCKKSYEWTTLFWVQILVSIQKILLCGNFWQYNDAVWLFFAGYKVDQIFCFLLSLWHFTATDICVILKKTYFLSIVSYQKVNVSTATFLCKRPLKRITHFTIS